MNGTLVQGPAGVALYDDNGLCKTEAETLDTAWVAQAFGVKLIDTTYGTFFQALSDFACPSCGRAM